MITRVNKWLVLIVLILNTAPLPAADATGTITGKIDRPGDVAGVFAIHRGDDKKYPARFDAASGKFTIEGLPLGAAYDCVIDFGKARLEGVNFKVPKHDFDTDEELPATKEDVAKLKETALALNQFEDQIEVMAVAGNVQHAVVLLNKLRTKPFVGSNPGEVIWRLELWRFEKPDETWIKVQDELWTVFYRQRLQKAEFEKKSLMLDPALGGLKPTEKQKTIDLGAIALPGAEPGIRLREVKK